MQMPRGKGDRSLFAQLRWSVKKAVGSGSSQIEFQPGIVAEKRTIRKSYKVAATWRTYAIACNIRPTICLFMDTHDSVVCVGLFHIELQEYRSYSKVHWEREEK